MRKIKEVLRLKYEANLSFRQIAASLKLSVGVISKYTQAAEVAGVSWPLPDGLDDATLEARLFPLAAAVYGILCKRVFSLKRRHAIFELNCESVQGSFPVMNGHGPFPANVV